MQGATWCIQAEHQCAKSSVASKRHCERYVVKDSAGATRVFAVGKGVLKMDPRLNISVVRKENKKGNKIDVHKALSYRQKNS